MTPPEFCKSIVGFVMTDTVCHFLVTWGKWVAIHFGVAAIAIGRAKLRGA